MKTKLRDGLITIAVLLIIWFLPVPQGVKPEAWHLLAIFVATIVGFILHPIPTGAIAITAIGLSGFLKVIKPAEALSGFGNTTIWLIVSAFIFALGFIKTGLGRRIAYTVMKAIGDSSLKVAYALAIADLVIAPATPSNTARGGGILFPVVRSLCSAFNSEPGESAKKIGSFLMNSAFQVNCITSAMFITSVAPNSLAVSLAAKAGVDISWSTWALACIVPGLIALAICPLVVYKLDSPEIKHTPEAMEVARRELEAMGPMSKGEKIVFGVFILALILWATASLTGFNATMTALVCVGIMLIGGAIEWKDVTENKSAWDTLIWMGSLMALASALNSYGLIKWAAGHIAASIAGMPWMTALGILIAAFMWSHYAFASLSAHTAAMYAAFLAVAITAGAPPLLAAMSLGCLIGLMGGLTHYATGPAPIFFGAGYCTQGEFWKIGFILSVINVAIFIFIGGAWWKIIGIW